jgi:vancomycin resistance protein YoaR
MAERHMGSKKEKKSVIMPIAISAVFLLLIFLAGNFFIWKNNYQDKIYPGIKISGLNLGGRTLAEAKDLIIARTQEIEKTGLNFQSSEKTVTLESTTSSFNADLAYQIFYFDAEETAQVAFGNESGRTFIKYLLNRFKLKGAQEIKPVYTLNKDRVTSFLEENFKELNIEPGNAYFSLANSEADDYKLKNNQEKIGKRINYEAVLEEVIVNLDNLKNETIVLKTQSQYPTVKQTDISGLEPEAQKIISRGDLNLRWQEAGEETTTAKYWKIKPDKLITWVSVQKVGDKLALSLDQEKIKQYLKAEASPEIDKEAIQPRFEIKDGRVTSWQIGKNGRQVDLEASAAKITEEFLNGKNEIDLIAKDITGESLAADNNFQIKEIIGTGHSVFTGSPANRRHNIKVGADSLHGLLIKPGENFSLINALGNIDGAAGYLQELVIKGNKTVPEYGGGLCQIGTTVFRTALAAGLPITQRQNHSYRVSYYEPAGTDATIYDPQPDLRFVNDTGNYILIQARIVKNDLYFDFWGVKDGRIATTTYPTIYNIVKPEPTKIVETEDLKPGEKKCTESSHNGADAYFDYKVTYPEGATTTPIQETHFKSHYVPWQAVCLVGKTATSTATSTNATTSSSTTPIATSSSTTSGTASSSTATSSAVGN